MLATGTEQLRCQSRLTAQLFNPGAFAHGIGLLLLQVVHGPDVGAHRLGVGFGGLGQQVAGVGEGGQLLARQALDRLVNAVRRCDEGLGVLAVGHRKLQGLAVERVQRILSHAQRSNLTQRTVHLQRWLKGLGDGHARTHHAGQANTHLGEVLLALLGKVGKGHLDLRQWRSDFVGQAQNEVESRAAVSHYYLPVERPGDAVGNGKLHASPVFVLQPLGRSHVFHSGLGTR
ncbi:hypothetical protein D3C77_275180 [compost metagenome]